MSHARVTNGGLQYAQARRRNSPDIRTLRAAVFGDHHQSTAVAATGERLSLGHRVGKNGDVRCPHCLRISHNKWGTGPHVCDKFNCGKAFATEN